MALKKHFPLLALLTLLTLVPAEAMAESLPPPITEKFFAASAEDSSYPSVEPFEAPIQTSTATPSPARKAPADNLALQEDEEASAAAPPNWPGAPPFARDNDKLTGSVGLGAVMVPRFEGGSKYIAVPFTPLNLRYKGLQLRTRGLGLEADIIPSRKVDFGPILQVRLGRNGVGDSRVDALNEVDTALEAGAFLQVNSPPILNKQDSAFARISAQQDVLNAHGGTIITASSGYSLALTKKLRLGASLSSNFSSGEYMNAYYGVSPMESARSGLATFSPESGIQDVGANAFLAYSLNKKWGINAIGGYTRLVGDAADSSIVRQAGSPNRLFAGLFVTYSF